MFLGVALGAFGAHGLSDYFEKFPKLAGTFETAVKYHIYHALGLLAVGILARAETSSLLNWSGYLLLAGLLIFSGSLYILVATNKSWLGAITPIGGVAMLAGWACLFLYAIRY